MEKTLQGELNSLGIQVVEITNPNDEDGGHIPTTGLKLPSGRIIVPESGYSFDEIAFLEPQETMRVI